MPALHREVSRVSVKIEQQLNTECWVTLYMEVANAFPEAKKETLRRVQFRLAVQDSDAAEQNPLPSADTGSFPKLRRKAKISL